MLEDHHGETDAGAVDITDGSGFDWLKRLAKIQGAQTAIWDDIYRVYAVRWQPHGDPEVAFCYGNQTYSTLTPRNAVYTASTKETSFVFHGRAVGEQSRCLLQLKRQIQHGYCCVRTQGGK